jgi:acetylornithine deacetylase/succinyl-diaminopimelate desuccinylase-like protein
VPAILEMARQIQRIEGKTDYARGITCNVGLIKGGTGVNVVSAECTAEIDLRVPSQQLAEEMTHWFLGRYFVSARERTFPDRPAEASAASASCHWDWHKFF